MKTLLFVAVTAGFVPVAVGQTWTQTSAPVTNWSALASSADGSKLVAAVSASNGGIWVSTNSGGAWLPTTAPRQYWSCLAASADGSRLIAGVNYSRTEFGFICLSTNSGLQWTTNSLLPGGGWTSVASSADGSTLLALSAAATGVKSQVFTSTSSGNSWVATNANVLTVAASADGRYLAAPGAVTWLSTNAGNSWMATNSLKYSVSSVASSADGRRLVACGTNIYISTNFGWQWLQAAAPSLTWRSVASSADGSRLAAAASWTLIQSNETFYTLTNGAIYTSTNWGTTWVSNDVGTLDWSAIASSADGGKLVAAVNGGGIWTAHVALPPLLNILPTNGRPQLSWVLPSTNFLILQSGDLKHWGLVTNQPALNLTNLQNEVILPSSRSNGFYRLESP